MERSSRHSRDRYGSTTHKRRRHDEPYYRLRSRSRDDRRSYRNDFYDSTPPYRQSSNARHRESHRHSPRRDDRHHHDDESSSRSPDHRRRSSLRKKQKAKKKAKKRRKNSDEYDDSIGTYEGQVGDWIDHRYQIRREAGLGTFGRVLECHDATRDMTVAVKVVRAVKKYTDSAAIEVDILHHLDDACGSSQRDDSCCVRLLKSFMYLEHKCLVFESLGASLYEYLKMHHYRPFRLTVVRDVAYQLLRALTFCHTRVKLVHTDLKPENILLVQRSSCDARDERRMDDIYPRTLNDGGVLDLRSTCCPDPPLNNDIRLIDFGGATYDDDASKSRVISTRQYRAPEVLLGLPWSYPSDLWSAGCIIMELYLGELFFSTHENLQHLALIERIVGRFPREMVQRALDRDRRGMSRFFDDTTSEVRWPEKARSKSSESHVRNTRVLSEQILEEDAKVGFLDFIQGLLTIDPAKRLTAEEATRHPFFNDCAYATSRT